MARPKTKEKTITFRLKEENYDRLKTAAIASKKTMTELIEELIQRNLQEIVHEDLIKQFMKVDPHDRLDLLHRIKEEEEQQVKRKRTRKPKKSKNL